MLLGKGGQHAEADVLLQMPSQAAGRRESHAVVLQQQLTIRRGGQGGLPHRSCA